MGENSQQNGNRQCKFECRKHISLCRKEHLHVHIIKPFNTQSAGPAYMCAILEQKTPKISVAV